jgi:hypothetical protein
MWDKFLYFSDFACFFMKRKLNGFWRRKFDRKKAKSYNLVNDCDKDMNAGNGSERSAAGESTLTNPAFTPFELPLKK